MVFIVQSVVEEVGLLLVRQLVLLRGVGSLGVEQRCRCLLHDRCLLLDETLLALLVRLWLHQADPVEGDIFTDLLDSQQLAMTETQCGDLLATGFPFQEVHRLELVGRVVGLLPHPLVHVALHQLRFLLNRQLQSLPHSAHQVLCFSVMVTRYFRQTRVSSHLTSMKWGSQVDLVRAS